VDQHRRTDEQQRQNPPSHVSSPKLLLPNTGGA
jgi:hypothetical protein